MKSLTLSVVLCTYQGEAFLQQQLESLLAQTRLPDEIVAGDDASTDGSWDMLQEFAVSAQLRGVQVKLHRQSVNKGYVANFSDTLREASGDVLFLCDQDDVWYPAKLAEMEGRFLADPSITLICSNAQLVDAGGESLAYTLFDALGLKPHEWRAIEGGETFQVLLCRSMVTGATAAFRRELLDAALPVPEGWIHDEWLAMVATVTGRVDAVRQALIDYRQHGENQIGMRRRTWCDKWRDLVAPRHQQFSHEVSRMGVLRERLAGLGSKVPVLYLQQVDHRRQHFLRRLAIGKLPRYRRWFAVYAEAHRGYYKQYDTGMRSMLRDLMRRD